MRRGDLLIVVEVSKFGTRANHFVLDITAYEATDVVVLLLETANPSAQPRSQEKCARGPGWSGSCSGANSSTRFIQLSCPVLIREGPQEREPLLSGSPFLVYSLIPRGPQSG